MQDSDSVNGLSQWDMYAETLRAKLPVAPQPLMDFYVRWMPWVWIVFGIIVAAFLLLLALLGTVLTPLLILGGASAVQAGITFVIDSLVRVVASILEVVGGFLMLRRSLLGWWILAVGLAIGILINLFHVAIFWLAISLLFAYIHLEVKPVYR